MASSGDALEGLQLRLPGVEISYCFVPVVRPQVRHNKWGDTDSVVELVRSVKVLQCMNHERWRWESTSHTGSSLCQSQ